MHIHQEAFDRTKKAHTSTPVLQYYDVKKLVCTQCEASGTGHVDAWRMYIEAIQPAYVVLVQGHTYRRNRRHLSTVDKNSRVSGEK